jgi:hypothetical protein
VSDDPIMIDDPKDCVVAVSLLGRTDWLAYITEIDEWCLASGLGKVHGYFVGQQVINGPLAGLCSSSHKIYGFKTAREAMLFKLAWGGE